MSQERKQDLIWVASFDIGKNNFAWYIGEVNRAELNRITNIPSVFRYGPDGTTTPRMENLLTEIYLNGRTISHEKKDLTYNCAKSKYLDPEIFHNLTEVLDGFADHWDRCSYFVIEQQMSYRGKINTMALKIGQHCYSYFCLKYGREKRVIEFPAYFKTSVLGALKIETRNKNGSVRWKKIDKSARKKWAVGKAIEILELRGEEEVIENMRNNASIGKRGKRLKAKLDDLADTLVQYIAALYKIFVDKAI